MPMVAKERRRALARLIVVCNSSNIAFVCGEAETEGMAKAHLCLGENDRVLLQELVKKTSVSRKVFQRARALLALDEGHTLQSVASLVEANYNTVASWRDLYSQEGLTMLHDKPRSGRPPHIEGTQRAAITALACSTPPQGHARWSLRLLASHAVELGLLEAVSHNQVGKILKKTTCNHT